MGNDRYRDDYGSTSGNRHNDKENRARREAYEEYLRLREHRSSRGNYVKDDTLYGAYFPSGNSDKGRSSGYSGSRREEEREPYRTGGAADDTPYGNSRMRKQRHQAELERERYLAQRAEAKKQIARQGRRNRADEDIPAAEILKSKRRGTGKQKSGRRLKVALIVVLVLVLGIGGIIAAGLTVVKNTLDNVGRIELDPDMIGINPQVDSDLRNYRNIAILGIDARDMSDDTDVRSDAVIIASINKETNEIKMFSVYRDTMLDLGDDVGIDKITHAYYYGGPTKVLYTLNKNLDLNIKEVVVVNWKSVADTVDALGGLDIEIQESEISEMNKYIQDTYNNIGGSNEKIDSAGMQTLNGNQAVTYARIRKDAVTGDFRRNERMKIVVKAAFEKAKTMNPKALKKISNEILPEIKTNMSSSDMMGMVLKLTSYTMTDSVGFPYQLSDWNSGAYYAVPVTLRSNVSRLHEEFFGQTDYTPTQDVQSISENIAAMTGYY